MNKEKKTLSHLIHYFHAYSIIDALTYISFQGCRFYLNIDTYKCWHEKLDRLQLFKCTDQHIPGPFF